MGRMAEDRRAALVGDEVVLDLRGLKCPLPALRTEKAMRSRAPGAAFTVLATDPMAAIDIPHAVNQAGARLLETARDGEVLRFRIALPARPSDD